jgi:pimeloyl-ACP methyl ester carboxylesterase
MTTPRCTYTYDGIHLAYTDSGCGSPLLFLHGFGASSYSWRYLIEWFSAQYRTLSIDLKGFGVSDKPRGSDYSLKAQSDSIKRFIEEKQLENVVLVGHSFGGGVALLTHLAMKDSGRDAIKQLILLDSMSYPQALPFFIQFLRTPVLNKLSLALLSNKFSTRIILKLAFFDRSKITEEMVNTYATYSRRKGSHHALIMTAYQIIPADMRSITQKYKSINIPVLVIWGEQDNIVPLSIGQRLSRDIPNAQCR